AVSPASFNATMHALYSVDPSRLATGVWTLLPATRLAGGVPPIVFPSQDPLLLKWNSYPIVSCLPGFGSPLSVALVPVIPVTPSVVGVSGFTEVVNVTAVLVADT